MAVYQITYKSGTQQFLELDTEEADELGNLMFDYFNWLDQGKPSEPKGMLVRPLCRPHRIFRASTGAVVDVTEVAGFQHFIRPSYANWRAAEDGPDPLLSEAMDAAIQAMLNNGWKVTSPEGPCEKSTVHGAINAAFLNALT